MALGGDTDSSSVCSAACNLVGLGMDLRLPTTSSVAGSGVVECSALDCFDILSPNR